MKLKCIFLHQNVSYTPFAPDSWPKFKLKNILLSINDLVEISSIFTFNHMFITIQN